MATYKLIQDIEAEDHILGPLTLRQFIFAMIACFFIWMDFLVAQKGASFMLLVFVPPTLFFIFFALPLGRDQPTEIWALAKLRYLFKPRLRTWNQDGVKELVTITAPKKIEPVLTNGLSQTEVKSRLQALADTLDTRGWAVKNIGTGGSSIYANPLAAFGTSDRLLEIGSMAQEVPDSQVPYDADILDERDSPMAQQFDNMIDQSSQAHRQHLINQLNATSSTAQSPSTQQNDYWFMNGNAQAPSTVNAPQAVDMSGADEAALTSELKSHSTGRVSPYSNLRTFQPGNSQAQTPVAAQDNPATPPMTAQPDPAILALAKNDDLNVSTLAREAKRATGEAGNLGSDEVVIPLH